jgi:hypothetical protein
MDAIDESQVYTWVHTWWGRGAKKLPYLESALHGDLAGKFTVHKQGKGQDRDAFYLELLRDICSRPGVDYMMRIEDDVEVGSNLLHNVLRWPALTWPRFGIGFLTTSDRIMCRRTVIHPTDDAHTVEYKALDAHFGGVWIASTKALLTCMPMIKDIMRYIRKLRRFGPTTSVSDAMFKNKFRIFIHLPALARVDVSIPSHQLGDVSKRYGKQPFDPEFRR